MNTIADDRISQVRVRGVDVPLATPIRTASGDVTHVPLVLVDVLTAAGITGRAYVFTYNQLAARPTVELTQSFGERLLGKALSPLQIVGDLQASVRLLGGTGLVRIAISAIDMALWDALSKSAGMPLFQLLGGAPVQLPAYLSVGMDGVQAAREAASKAIAEGFSALKIKIGYKSLEEDIAVIEAALKGLGSRARLMVDYNQSLTVPEALRRCRRLDEYDLLWIEEPVDQDDNRGLAEIANCCRTPIQLGENWDGLWDMSRALEARASDLAMLDVMKIGGVSGWLAAAHLASANALPVSSHIFQEFSAHLLAASPSRHYLEYLPKADAILETPLPVHGGYVTPASEPGAGLSWNENAVERYRL